MIMISILVLILFALPVLVACDEDTVTGTASSPSPPDTETPTQESGVPHLPVPQHPFLAPNGRSNSHNDAYMTDTYEFSGPLNINPEVTLKSFTDGPSTVATITFDEKGRILTTSAAMMGFEILLLDPETLEVIASYQLPRRDPTDPLFPYNDTSGATYFALDNEDRIMLTDSENAIQIIMYNDEQGEFEQVSRFDLSDHIMPMEPPARDHVQMTLPDWQMNYLWFMTRYGKVGTVDPQTGEVHTIDLIGDEGKGEEMQNSFAVGEDGVYILSDHAMYRFSADEDGAPVIDWRTAYDRGTRVKPSNFNQGSGTTPQIFGDLVAIGDNAEPRMNILFLSRSDGSEVCRIPVFDDGLSTTENALPGLVRQGENGLEYSVIVDNNYGILREKILQPGQCWIDHAGGLCRIDLVPDENGEYACRQVWRSPEKSSQILPKLSLADGLLYVYTYEATPDDDYNWSLTAVDFNTGETAFSIPTGKGLEYANFGPQMSIGPDNAVYFGSMRGMVSVRDGALTCPPKTGPSPMLDLD